MENPGALAGLVGALVILAEVIKYLVSRLVPQKQLLPKEDQEQRDATRTNVQTLVDTMPKLLQSISSMTITVDRLWEVHNKHDQDGVPVWYVPRSWAETQEKVVENLRQVAELTRRSLELLERIERRSLIDKSKD